MNKTYAYICLIILLLAVSASAIDYKKYKSNRKQVDYFQVEYSRDNNEILVLTISENTVSAITGNKNKLSVNRNQVFFGDKLIFDDKNVYINNQILSLDKITDCKISEVDNLITISFFTTKDSSKLARFKKGNRISVGEEIYVSEDDFVR